MEAEEGDLRVSGARRWGTKAGADLRPGLGQPQRRPAGTHLRPRAGVPLEAGPLEAGALLGGLLGQPALGATARLWLPVGQLHAQDQPLFDTPATGGVALSPGDRQGSEAGSTGSVRNKWVKGLQGWQVGPELFFGQ